MERNDKQLGSGFFSQDITKRLYVEQYRLIQMLCGGMGVTDITDVMDIIIMDITDIMDVTDKPGKLFINN